MIVLIVQELKIKKLVIIMNLLLQIKIKIKLLINLKQLILK